MLSSLARFSVRHRWLVIALWLLAVLGAGLAARSSGGEFSNDLTLSDSDSQAAYDTLRERYPDMSGDGMQVVIHNDGDVTSPEVKKAVADSLTEVRGTDGVAAAQSPYGPGPAMVSEDGRTAMATVRFEERAKDVPAESVEAAQEAFAPVRDTGAQVEFGGAVLQTESGPSGSEAIGLAAAVLVLLVAFGSVFAMVVPLVTALFALVLGLSAVHLAAGLTTIGTSGPVVAAMIGLGVGIDYALLVVTRHREAMRAGHAPAESIPLALSTAGRSVLVAGATVIVAILSLYLIGIPFVSALGLASALTVAATLLAAVTLLPALLAVFGDRLDRFRVRRLRFDHGSGRASGWHRWTAHIQRHPWPYLLASTVTLVALALPLFSLRLGTADDGSAPEDTTQRRAYELVTDDFGPGWTGPLVVTADFGGDGSPTEVREQAAGLRTELEKTAGVAEVRPPQLDESGTTALYTVVPEGSPDEESTEELVHRLRDDVLPGAVEDTEGAEAHVGGSTATAIDLADRLGREMGWFMTFVVGLSFLLLTVEFRSLVVPLKAAVMNLLSVGAAYGVVVAVFQWGWGAGLLGAEPGPVESFAPIMLFAVLFGLSMDYEVFLLSRVREEYLRTGDTGGSVRDGIAATARVITAAASVMVVVFGSFQLNDQRVVNLFGFGLAVAIAIDATLVRLVLVPSVMAVLGRAAWWMPRPLQRLLPRLPGEAADKGRQPAGGTAGDTAGGTAGDTAGYERPAGAGTPGGANGTPGGQPPHRAPEDGRVPGKRP
ncbi:MMPL family transporter [Streptomyces sp. F63]|uniref:MMPL family transporter n=1 Tax=Streptomyces sp. F63 TaxID=2824887 RepID=UPI001B35BEE7|nr:MMPL family transporter [Streptomyces sp. F63]MBQ0986788.1 MMPL family transporter [Streptomyces sp. F63]